MRYPIDTVSIGYRSPPRPPFAKAPAGPSVSKDGTNVQISKIERVIVHHEPRKEDMDDGAGVIDHV